MARNLVSSLTQKQRIQPKHSIQQIRVKFHLLCLPLALSIQTITQINEQGILVVLKIR